MSLPGGHANVDPELVAVLATYLENKPVWSAETLPGIRAALAVELAPDGERDGLRIADHHIERDEGTTLFARSYVPVCDVPPRGMLWIHGGGMVSGSVALDEPRAVQLARDARVAVISVEYRLAPEHLYPAQVEDCQLAWEWLAEHGSTLGIDTRFLAVGGNSAGAGLAAATTLRLRDQGMALPDFQLLIYPMLDDRRASPSSTAYDLVWGAAANEFGWASLLGADIGGSEVPADAAPARCSDVSQLPPTYIEVGELDVLRDEVIAFANRLMQAGVATELHVFAGAFHGFDRLVPEAGVSRLAEELRTRALTKAIRAADATG